MIIKVDNRENKLITINGCVGNQTRNLYAVRQESQPLDHVRSTSEMYLAVDLLLMRIRRVVITSFPLFTLTT